MCIKMGEDEIETVRNLMKFTLMEAIAEALDIEADDIALDQRFAEDLHLNGPRAGVLRELIGEYFDGLQVNLAEVPTVGGLLERVLQNELASLAA